LRPSTAKNGQYNTGRRFNFLKYRDAHNPGSGSGSDATHDVRNDTVETLVRLIVRLAREELARQPGAWRRLARGSIPVAGPVARTITAKARGLATICHGSCRLC